MVNIKIKQLNHDLPLPKYAYKEDAGIDLHSNVTYMLYPNHRVLVPTGICLAIPAGYVGFICPRSGLAIKYGITVLNAPGIIDSGYRGEIKIILISLDSKNKFIIRRGQRIAQLIIQKIEHINLIPANNLDKTLRENKGFGSTG